MTLPIQTACAVREVARAGDLLAVFPALLRRRNAWLLDSAMPAAGLGRFSFAGADPYLVMSARGRTVSLDVRRDVRPDLTAGRHVRHGDPLEILRAAMPPSPSSVDPSVAGFPFLGGAVACLGYALAESTEPIRFAPREDATQPDLCVLFVDRLLALDVRSGVVWAIGLGFAHEERAAASRAGDAVEALLAQLGAVVAAGPPRPARRRPEAQSSLCGTTARAYAERVLAAKARIEAGDAYQICLTHRLESAFHGDPWSLYTALRRISPSPFAAFLTLDDALVLSSSPERFLRLDAERVAETRPIKGTRPRGADPASDAKQRTELLASAKDRAENVMITDLARNDLGRVCTIGSIRVTSLCALETYATVFQLVSSIAGRLSPERDVFDLVRAAFPPGSMTGAPKLAAMRILDGLEPDSRGFYGGALGYFDVRGGADLSVVIRSLFLRDGRAAIHVGGGVVADSDPAAEWQESMDKAAALVSALATADTPDGPAGISAAGGAP